MFIASHYESITVLLFARLNRLSLYRLIDSIDYRCIRNTPSFVSILCAILLCNHIIEIQKYNFVTLTWLQNMGHSVFTWVKERWRLLFIILVPLLLLPLPVVHNTPVGLLFIHHCHSDHPFVGRKMWIYCTHPHFVLDHWSYSTGSHIFITVDSFSYGKPRMSSFFNTFDTLPILM